MIRKRNIKKGRLVLVFSILILILGLIVWIIYTIFDTISTAVLGTVPLLDKEVVKQYFTNSENTLTRPQGWIFATEDTNEVLFYQLSQVIEGSEFNSIKINDTGINAAGIMGVTSVEVGGRLDFKPGENLLDHQTLTQNFESSSGAKGPYQILTQYFWDYMKFDVKLDKNSMKLDYENIQKSAKIPEPDKLSRLYYPTVASNVAYYLSKAGYSQMRSIYDSYIQATESKYNIKFTQQQLNEIYYCLIVNLYHGDTPSAKRQSTVDYIGLVIHEFGTVNNLVHLASRDASTFRVYSLGETNNTRANYNVKPFTISGKTFTEPLIKYISDKYNKSILNDYESLLLTRNSNGDVFINFTYGLDALVSGAFRVASAQAYLDKVLTGGGLSAANDSALKEYLQQNNITVTIPSTKLPSGNTTKGFSQSYMKTVNINKVDYKFPIFVFDNGEGTKQTVYYNGEEYTYTRISEENKYDLGEAAELNRYLVDVPQSLSTNEKHEVDLRVIPAFNEMKKAWESSVEYTQSKNPLLISSGYRSSKAQKELLVDYVNSINYLGRSDWSMVNIDTLVHNIYEVQMGNTEAAIRERIGSPYGTPHLTGRALDINRVEEDNILKGWLYKNANKFGFQNYAAESWHWEYNPSAMGGN